jgi:hypothetical protein
MTLATLTLRKWDALTSADQGRIVEWLENQVKTLRTNRSKISGTYRARYIVTLDFTRRSKKRAP